MDLGATVEGKRLLLLDSVKGLRRSMSCGLGPDTGKLRFLSSAFKSATFISSRFPASLGRLRALAGIDVSALVDCLGATDWVGLAGGRGGGGGAGGAALTCETDVWTGD